MIVLVLSIASALVLVSPWGRRGGGLAAAIALFLCALGVAICVPAGGEIRGVGNAILGAFAGAVFGGALAVRQMLRRRAAARAGSPDDGLGILLFPVLVVIFGSGSCWVAAQGFEALHH
jgi:hypothetical protein